MAEPTATQPAQAPIEDPKDIPATGENSASHVGPLEASQVSREAAKQSMLDRLAGNPVIQKMRENEAAEFEEPPLSPATRAALEAAGEVFPVQQAEQPAPTPAPGPAPAEPQSAVDRLLDQARGEKPAPEEPPATPDAIDYEARYNELVDTLAKGERPAAAEQKAPAQTTGEQQAFAASLKTIHDGMTTDKVGELSFGKDKWKELQEGDVNLSLNDVVTMTQETYKNVLTLITGLAQYQDDMLGSMQNDSALSEFGLDNDSLEQLEQTAEFSWLQGMPMSNKLQALRAFTGQKQDAPVPSNGNPSPSPVQVDVPAVIDRARHIDANQGAVPVPMPGEGTKRAYDQAVANNDAGMARELALRSFAARRQHPMNTVQTRRKF